MTAISYHDTVNDVQAIDLAARGPFGRTEWFAALEGNGHSSLYAVLGRAYGTRHRLTGDPFYESPARVPPGPIPRNTAEVC